MPNHQTGITLIEVMVSLAVLTIGILGVLQSFPMAIQKEAIAKNSSIASYFAQGQMELLLSYSYDSDFLATGTTETETGSNYHIQTDISYADPFNELNNTSTDLGIKKIKVKVFWIQDVPEQTVEISTLYSKK